MNVSINYDTENLGFILFSFRASKAYKFKIWGGEDSIITREKLLRLLPNLFDWDRVIGCRNLGGDCNFKPLTLFLLYRFFSQNAVSHEENLIGIPGFLGDESTINALYNPLLREDEIKQLELIRKGYGHWKLKRNRESSLL